eukprot:362727-Prorocentrum_minimum.AAC.1
MKQYYTVTGGGAPAVGAARQGHGGAVERGQGGGPRDGAAASPAGGRRHRGGADPLHAAGGRRGLARGVPRSRGARPPRPAAAGAPSPGERALIINPPHYQPPLCYHLAELARRGLLLPERLRQVESNEQYTCLSGTNRKNGSTYEPKERSLIHL